MIEFDDPLSNFPNKVIEKILMVVKQAFVLGLQKALYLIPKEKVVDCESKCNSEELKRQYRSFERALAKWDGGQDPSNRTYRGLKVIQKAYFTIVNHEANYLKFSALILDEYRKERKW